MRTFLVITTGEGVGNTTGGVIPRMLLNFLKDMGQLHTTQNYLAQNVNNTEVDESCSVNYNMNS